MEDSVTLLSLLCSPFSLSPDVTTNDPRAADNTTQNLDSSTSEGRATTLTSGLAVALALTLCLLILT